jgi:hypothetical protein
MTVGRNRRSNGMSRSVVGSGSKAAGSGWQRAPCDASPYDHGGGRGVVGRRLASMLDINPQHVAALGIILGCVLLVLGLVGLWLTRSGRRRR